jgi:hypothetical protein
MNANPALSLFVGLAVAESKGLTGGDATKVAMLAAIAPFPMGVVLASVVADREAPNAVPTAKTTVSTGTGGTTGAGSGAGAGTGSGIGSGTGTGAGPPPPPSPGKPPPQEPAVILGNEFAKLQTAAAQLALHASQATIDTELDRLVEDIRHAREEIDEENRAALRIDRVAREELAESEATEKREEAARRKGQSGGSTAHRGS